MKPIRSVSGVKDPYSQRILSYVIGKDPLRVLAATPRRLRRLLRGLSMEQIRKRPGKGKWSIAELICHLADAEVVLAFRYRMVIAQSGSPLQAMDENQWASGLNYRKADAHRKLELFAIVRDDHVRMLKSLPKKALQRYGVHEERGKETVERIAQLYAGHDINHLRQIGTVRKWLMKGRSR
jgi:hypothetical protein